MLLPLLGACALVGPFQGAEWEPVRALLPEHRSCRDPRCCGNLLVLFLFVIWQVRHSWHQVTRSHPRMKKTIKVPPQKWAEPSMRCDPCLERTPEFLFSPDVCRGLGAHVQPWARKGRWACQRRLQQPWPQCQLSWQQPRQGPSWDVLSSAESISFSSFSSTSVLPQDSFWEAWQAPWCPHDHQTRTPARHRRVGQLPVHSQEKPVSEGAAVSLPPHLVSVASATSFPKLPSARRLPFCSRELLLVSSAQQVRMPTRMRWSCPREAWASGRESQTRSREESGQTQALEWASQKEDRGDEARAVQAPRRQPPVGFGLKDDAETRVLEAGGQRPGLSQTDRGSLTPGWEKREQMGLERRASLRELRERNQRAAAAEGPSETQPHRGEAQEQSGCKTDAETQTPAWGNLVKSSTGTAAGTQALEKSKKEDRGGEGGETQTRGSGVQRQAASESGEEALGPGWAEQSQVSGDSSTEIQAERRDQGQAGAGTTVMQIQVPETQTLAGVHKGHAEGTWARGRGKRGCAGGGTLTETPGPGWEEQGQHSRERPGETPEPGGESQKQPRREVQVGRGPRGLQRGEGPGASQPPPRKLLREIRQEDWMVMEVLWWGDQAPAISELVREFEMPPRGKRGQDGGGHSAEAQVRARRGQKGGGEGCTDALAPEALAPEAEGQAQLRGDIHVEGQPSAGRNQEQFGKKHDNDSSSDIQAPRQRDPKGVTGDDSEDAQKPGEEKQGQLSREVSGDVNRPEWGSHQRLRSRGGADTPAAAAEDRGEQARDGQGRTRLMEREQEERAGGEKRAEVTAPGDGRPRAAGAEEGPETWAAGEGDQGQLRGDTDGKAHLSERQNPEHRGGENGAQMEPPETRNQREFGDEDGAETQRPERRNRRRSPRETGEALPPWRRAREQAGDQDIAENQAPEKRNEREVGSEDGRNIQKRSEVNLRLIQRKTSGDTWSSEWQNQGQTGGDSDAETQVQGDGQQSGTRGEDGSEAQAPEGDEQKWLRSETASEIGGAAEIQGVGSQSLCGSEGAGGRGGSEDRSRGREAAGTDLQVDCSGSEGPPALSGSGHEVTEQEEAAASAPCPEGKRIPSREELIPVASGQGEHLASQSSAPARKGKVEVPAAPQQARPKPQRRRRRNQEVAPGEASRLTEHLQNPQSLAAPLGLASACPSLSCDGAPQAAAALVGVPPALTVLPKWPALKKSQRLLLESLMRRKMAHLQWGLPQRIRASHSLSDLKELHSLPLAAMELPGVEGGELRGQQGAPGSRPVPKKPQRPPPPVRKNSNLPTGIRTLERCGPPRFQSSGISVCPEKPRRSRPPGGPREPQAAQAEAPLRTTLWDPPESRSSGVPERVGALSSESGKGRNLVRPGISLLAERRPHSRTRCDSWEGECPPQKPVKPPRRWARGSLASTHSRDPGQQPCSSSSATPSFKGGLYSAAAGLGRTLLGKLVGGPPLAEPQHSAPSLSLRDPGPMSLRKGGDSQAGAGSVRDHTLKRDLQPPAHSWAAASLPKTEGPQSQGAWETPNGVPQNPSAPRKFGFVNYVRCFLHQHGFRR